MLSDTECDIYEHLYQNSPVHEKLTLKNKVNKFKSTEH